MNVVRVFHNPESGDKKYTKEDIIALIESYGYNCRYSSTKNGWQEVDPDIDFIVVAGGDGTVRDMAREILSGKWKNLPIALLPLGTANNIARALQIKEQPEEIIPSWKDGRIVKYDVGLITTNPDYHFFLEGFGYGVVPDLMKQMTKMDGVEEVKGDVNLKISLELLHEIILSYKCKDCHVVADGIDHSGKFLLVEVMNIRSIGPNLDLCPDADPGDGVIEVVLVDEAERERLASYIFQKWNGEDVLFSFLTIK